MAGGLVTGTIEAEAEAYLEAVADAIGNDSGRSGREEVQTRDVGGFSTSLIQRLLGAYAGQRSAYAPLLAELLGQLLTAYDRMVDRANAEEWPRRDVDEALDALRDRFGQMVPGNAAATTLADAAVGQPFQEAIADFPSATEVASVYPYFIYRIRDINTRENHRALDGFVWQAGWDGTATVVPPNGYNCYCWVEPVSWREAQANGWTGRFPLGTAKLERFLSLGGADNGFPKGEFIL